MGRRNCASCRFYERASIARMGWCRQPELYAAHQNHLVSALDLDCDRGIGDFWEPVTRAADTAVMRPEGISSEREVISVTRMGAPIFPVSGSSGLSSDPPPPAPGGGGGGSGWGDGEGDYNYYDEERYWTDYIRIAAPILGVIVLVILLWFWIASFLGDDDNDPNDAASGTTTALPTLASTPAETPDTGATPSPPGPAPTATTPGTGGTAVPTATEDTGGPTDIYLGATVEVANTDGTGVNVRETASTSSAILTVFLDGTQSLVIDGPVEAEGFIWWQVTGNEVAAGWIVADYLVVIE